MWKPYISLAALVVLGVLGCGRTTNDEDADAEAQAIFDRQVEAYDQGLKRSDELLVVQEEQMKKIDRILEKWEEQARRQDAILSAEEKRLGIEK